MTRSKHALSPSATLRINSAEGTQSKVEGHAKHKQNYKFETRNPKQIRMIQTKDSRLKTGSFRISNLGF
jgi:hypothetical protein